VKIDRDAVVHDFVTIYPNVHTEANVEIFEGAVIGKPPTVTRAFARPVSLDLSTTVISTVDSIARCRAKPILTDTEPDTYCINRAEIENRITERTNAILPVRLQGPPTNMEEILESAR
jgi:hypothetical protein